MSKDLEKARIFEEDKESVITREQRPGFHLSSRVGWMNDPNGFSWYKGEYHLFYQYHPYDSHWGPMHWGHAVSSDLLHWKYLPAVLAPDQPYDRDGCFSGGAIELPDGRHMIMYTGVAKERQEDGSLKDIQTQNLAFGDGLHYEKYQYNPVLTEKDLPDGGSRYSFRDPKMWKMPDGSFRMIAVNDTEHDGGQVLLYRSEDGIKWHYEKKLAENHNRIGLMWECPDFFELNGKMVLLASSMDMLPQGFEYHNGNGTFYMTGAYDPQNENFYPENDHAVDYGIDFYAPQTILSPDGRRIMIGWMQNWDTCNLHTPSTPWFGQMSLPRELSLKNGILYQKPLRELENLRKDKVTFENVYICDQEISLEGIEGRMVDLEAEIVTDRHDDLYSRFAIRFAKNDRYHTGVSFRPHESTLKIDRKFSGSRRAIIHQRRAKVDHMNGHIKLRIILDRYSVEIFVNDGEKVLSAILYTDLDAQEISFFADGAVRMNVTKYSLAEQASS